MLFSGHHQASASDPVHWILSRVNRYDMVRRDTALSMRAMPDPESQERVLRERLEVKSTRR